MSLEDASKLNYYGVLGILQTASTRDIRRAHRLLARKYHPDLNPGDTTAASKFLEIQEAYEVLSDKARRNAYDIRIGRIAQPAARPTSTPKPAQSSPRTPLTPDQLRELTRQLSRKLHPDPAGKSGWLLWTFVAIAMVFAVLLLLPSAGEKHFRRAQQALKGLQSWKVEVRSRSIQFIEQRELHEVSCPDYERTSLWLRMGGPAVQFMTIADQHYIYNDRANNWQQLDHNAVLPMLGSGSRSICERIARGEDTEPFPPFGKWLQSSNIQIDKVAMMHTRDGDCQEWKIEQRTAKYPRGVVIVDYVCLNILDDMPLSRKSVSTQKDIRYFDINVPVEMAKP